MNIPEEHIEDLKQYSTNGKQNLYRKEHSIKQYSNPKCVFTPTWSAWMPNLRKKSKFYVCATTDIKDFKQCGISNIPVS